MCDLKYIKIYFVYIIQNCLEFLPPLDELDFGSNNGTHLKSNDGCYDKRHTSVYPAYTDKSFCLTSFKLLSRVLTFFKL
ncbi:unnamed protein product [Acanthoscelides obtectus]|uniref:Uncharacterized protein n=1 Tax=Acanthoscelides obtectus TaxID=200917 RepID=A0A9P0P706_ACAOB|nr:unnamed protein product [Acanthoscelides obtectus]CAK1633514.1 hypothetical protein AOBTE_LOCUS8188 [Acanthoscelides obtectus]